MLLQLINDAQREKERIIAAEASGSYVEDEYSGEGVVDQVAPVDVGVDGSDGEDASASDFSSFSGSTRTLVPKLVLTFL